MYPKVLLSDPIFSAKELIEILENSRYSQRHTNYFLFCRTVVLVFCKDRKTSLRSTMVQDCINQLALLSIERTYFNRVDIKKVIDEFPSKAGRSKFFFQPIFRSKKVGDLF